MQHFKSIFLFLIILLSHLDVQAFTKGNSAWLYGKEDSWITQIQKFNTNVPAANRLNYLFPETGIIHVDSIHDKLLMTYDPSVTAFYKTRLKNVKIIADLSFWVANTSFKKWPVSRYQEAADQIATLVNNDPNADGVFLDLESYEPTLLPFYHELVKNLKLHNKIISVIIRPGEENTTWFKALGNNAFVVLYGYDLHKPEDTIFPVSPHIYQQRLQTAVDHLMKVAEISHMPVMCGIPVVATTYEWEQKITAQATLKSPYHQIDYFRAALDVYNQIKSPRYLGFSIWAFLSASKPQAYLPFIISTEEWALLYGNH